MVKVPKTFFAQAKSWMTKNQSHGSHVGCRIRVFGALLAFPSFWYRLWPELSSVERSTALPLSFGNAHLYPRLKAALVYSGQSRSDSRGRPFAA